MEVEIKKCEYCGKKKRKERLLPYVNAKNEHLYFCNWECLGEHLKEEFRIGKGKIEGVSQFRTTLKEAEEDGSPVEKGVYVLNFYEKCLYVGRSNSLTSRLRTHFRGNNSSSLRRKLGVAPTWKEEDITKVTVELYPIEEKEEQTREEKKLIRKLDPAFNGVSTAKGMIAHIIDKIKGNNG